MQEQPRARSREPSRCATPHRRAAVAGIGSFLLGVLLFATLARAQIADPATDIAYFDAVEVGGGEGWDVDLFVRVESAAGRPVDLPSAPPWPFVIRQDGRPVAPDEIQVLKLEQTEQGIACVVVLDVSPTMSAVFPQAKKLVRSFMDQLGPADSLALVTASGEPIVYAGFSSSLDEIAALIDGLETEREPRPTRLLDAIDLALQRMREDASLPPRRFVLVVSDGSDGGSGRSLEQVIEAAAPSDGIRSSVYGVVLRDPAFGDGSTKLLQSLAESTGGATLREPGLSAAFYDEIWRRMRRSNVLRYRTSMDGARHSIELIMDGLVPPDVRVVTFPRLFWMPGGLIFVAVALGLVGAIVAFGIRASGRAGCLIVVGSGSDGMRFKLRRGINEVGSFGENDIVVPSPAVSRFHAIIRVGRRGAEIEDRQSTNGTLLNDKPITVSPLLPGDRIRLGDVELMYQR